MTVLCLNKKFQSKRNLKLFAFILLFGFIGIFSSNNAFAVVDNEFEGTCIRCGGIKGTYQHITTDDGRQYTLFFYPDGKRVEIDTGHVDFFKIDDGNNNDNPLDNSDYIVLLDYILSYRPAPIDLQSDMYMYSAGSINYSIINNPSNGNVTVDVIDPATNQTLQSLSVASEAQIDASCFVPHQPYTIVSTTKEGAIEVKTIMVSETELFIAD